MRDLKKGMKDKCGINSGGYDFQLPPKTELGIVSIATQLFGRYGHAVQLECMVKRSHCFQWKYDNRLGNCFHSNSTILMLQSCSSTRVCTFKRSALFHCNIIGLKMSKVYSLELCK